MIISSLLKEVEQKYIKIQEHKKQLESLQTIEIARAEYEKYFIQEESQLIELEDKKRKLNIEYRSLTVPKIDSRPIVILNKPKHTGQNKPQFKETIFAPIQKEEAISQKREMELREHFKKQINRFYRLKVDANLLGQINRIADDSQRLLGEALALLDWSIFEDYALKINNDISKLETFQEWGKELQEYNNQLSYDVKAQQERFRPYLKIWELWNCKDLSENNSTAWDSLIAETRITKQATIAELQSAISDLESKIVQINAVRTQSGE